MIIERVVIILFGKLFFFWKYLKDLIYISWKVLGGIIIMVGEGINWGVVVIRW